ncbi:MAG: DUF3857 and transglutaminase domain-containing protein, partial [Candidatus Eisenbacteria bacterium]|nr:DUF3857 and transglutaminase domain-containing protein [Candidatus Eisenbacteria bacterium]
MKRLPTSLIAIAVAATAMLTLAANRVVAQEAATTAPADQWQGVDVQALIENAPNEDQYPDASAVFLNLQETASVAEDGSVVTTRNRLIKVLTLRGRERYSNQEFLYDTAAEELDVIKGTTVRKTGRIVEVEEDAINEVTPSFLEGATMYANVLNKVISFPVAGPGSVMELQIRGEREPSDDLSYSGVEYLGAMDPVLEASFTIRYPDGADAPVTVGYLGGLGAIVMDKSAETGEITYAVSDVPALVEEEYMPPATELYPAVLYSSYQSWDGPSAFFADAFFPHVQTDGAIAEHVSSLTEGLTGRENIIRALFLDVATGVRNVYLNLGLGGYEPNDAATVLENKYADTRDKAVLLISLLRAAGIEAYPALVAAGTETRFTESVPTLKQFTRIIVDVPQGGSHKFLDPFLDDARYGFNRWGRGNTALLVRDDGSGELVQVPPFKPEENHASLKMTLALDDEGNADIEATCSLAGYFDRKTRMELKDLKPSEEQKVFDSAASGVSAGATNAGYTHSDLSDLTEPITVTQSIEVPGLAVAQGDMMIVHLPQFPFGFASTGVYPSLAERRYPFEFPCELVSELEIDLSLPEGYEVVWTPEDATVETEAATFGLSCRSDTQTHSVIWTWTVTVNDRSIP